MTGFFDYKDVHLTDNELAFCQIVAQIRNAPKEAAGVASKKMLATRSEADTHLMGICAEYAVASYCDVLPDVRSILQGDKGMPDLYVNGYSVEVKCRDRQGYDFALMTDNPADFKAEMGVLVYKLSDAHFRIWGVISRKKFLEVAEVKDYGYGRRLVAASFWFSSIDKLLALPAKQEAA